MTHPLTLTPRRHWLFLLCCTTPPLVVLAKITTKTATPAQNSHPDNVSSFSLDEQHFLQMPNANSARSSLKFLTHESHVAGTPGDWTMAELMATTMTHAGIPNVETFALQVGLNYPSLTTPPQLRLVEFVGEDSVKEDTNNDQDVDEEDGVNDGEEDELSTIINQSIINSTNKSLLNVRRRHKHHRRTIVFEAALTEDIVESDDTSDTIWRNHTFHGYSPSGQILATDHIRMVYANYGRPQDFDVLEQQGIAVQGRVVLVRYGHCFRGIKVRNAQQRGARGVILYSDPAEDGFQQGLVYPQGPWRPSSGVQRGSVMFNSACAGDPYRLDERYQGKTVEEICGIESMDDLIPTIPSIPISYHDALPFLQNLAGPVAGDVDVSFVGGLSSNVTYRLGPSRAFVELVVENTNVNTTIPNVIGMIPGTLPADKDMPVLLGNHRDAWVFGAADPNSGTAVLLEVVQALGRLYRDFEWRPLRSVYFLSWSGEEYGLLGSTGWAELNAELPVIQRALAYLNSDTAVSGDLLGVSASPSLISLWKSVMEDLNTTTTTAATAKDNSTHRSTNSVHFANPPYGDIRDTNTNWKIDHTHHNDYRNDETEDTIEEMKKKNGTIGVLGSGSDFTVFLDHFGIPSLDFSFSKHTAYGQYHSIYDSFAWMDRFGGRDGEPGSSFDLMVDAAKIWGLLAMRLASSPLVPLDHIQQGRSLNQYTNFIREQIQSDDTLNITNLDVSVKRYKEAAAQLHVKCSGVDAPIDECNERLGLTERFLLLKDGLPNRTWFKHCLQAPGLDLGYAAEAFPGIQQALDIKDFAVAQQQVEKTAHQILAAAKNLGIGSLVTAGA